MKIRNIPELESLVIEKINKLASRVGALLIKKHQYLNVIIIQKEESK